MSVEFKQKLFLIIATQFKDKKRTIFKIQMSREMAEMRRRSTFPAKKKEECKI